MYWKRFKSKLFDQGRSFKKKKTLKKSTQLSRSKKRFWIGIIWTGENRIKKPIIFLWSIPSWDLDSCGFQNGWRLSKNSVLIMSSELVFTLGKRLLLDILRWLELLRHGSLRLSTWVWFWMVLQYAQCGHALQTSSRYQMKIVLISLMDALQGSRLGLVYVQANIMARLLQHLLTLFPWKDSGLSHHRSPFSDQCL